jgi:hypothetical protein
MTELTRDVIIKLARGAGFSNSDEVPIAAAICYFESHRNPAATNTNKDGSVDKGLWQINSKANADIIKAHGDPFVPARNALMAYDVYKRQGWDAWTVYRDRAKNAEWGNILGQAKFDAAHVPGRITVEKGDESAPGITSFGDTIAKPIGEAVSGPLKAVQDFGNKLLGFLNVSLALVVALVLLLAGIMLIARKPIGKVVDGTKQEMKKVAPPPVKAALTVEQRARQSLDYSNVRAAMKKADARAAADRAREALREGWKTK